MHVHNNQSLCNLWIDACWEEAAAKFDDEIVIRQFTKHRLAEMTYQHHLITYEHLERQQIAGEPVMDDYQEDAIMEAENRRQAYVSRTGMRVTNSIINDTVELVMFLSGPA